MPLKNNKPCCIVLVFLFFVSGMIFSSCSKRYAHLPKVKQHNNVLRAKSKTLKKQGPSQIFKEEIYVAIDSAACIEPRLIEPENNEAPSTIYKAPIIRNTENNTIKQSQHKDSLTVKKTEPALEEIKLRPTNFLEVLSTMVGGSLLVIGAAILASLFIAFVVIIIMAFADPQILFGLAILGFIALFALPIVGLSAVLGNFLLEWVEKIKIKLGVNKFTIKEIETMGKPIRLKRSYHNFIAALLLTLLVAAIFLIATPAILPIKALFLFAGFWPFLGITAYYLLKSVYILISSD